MIRFFDLQRQHRTIESQITSALSSVISSSQYLKGEQVKQFEIAFADLLGSKHCVTTANGTDSLYLALKALKVSAGDEVIVPAFTWISDASAVSMCGAVPVFVDVDKSDYTIHRRNVEAKISSRTKGIIAVHLYGHGAPIHDLRQLCNDRKLFMIEDCAQAHLTKVGDNYVGLSGDISTFSFYPTKNLGAYGDAGCIVTNDSILAEKCRRLANHGALVKNDHMLEGINSRMDTIQAAVLLAKLPFLKTWNHQRAINASLYNLYLKEISQLITPSVRADTIHTFHIYAIRANHRNELKAFLAENGIQTEIHYPAALPFVEPYKPFGHTPAEFPVSDQLQHEILSLPIYPELTEDEIVYICDKIKEFYKK